MSGVDELVRWLGEQLDEDERIARAASDGPWRSHRGPEKQWLGKGELIHPVYTWDRAAGTPVIMTAFWADSRHIAEWNPQQVLREIDAKRRLLAWLARQDDWALDNNLWTWSSDDALLLLALPYADRPGYREEWRP